MSSRGQVSCSRTPQHPARRSQGSNQQPSVITSQPALPPQLRRHQLRDSSDPQVDTTQVQRAHGPRGRYATDIWSNNAPAGIMLPPNCYKTLVCDGHIQHNFEIHSINMIQHLGSHQHTHKHTVTQSATHAWSNSSSQPPHCAAPRLPQGGQGKRHIPSNGS